MATAARRYLIQYDDNAVFAPGLTTAGELVLAGVHPVGSVVAVWFGLDGSLQRSELVSDSATSAAAWEALARWQSEIGFSPATISVEPFWSDELYVGIRDLPLFMKAYLEAAPKKGDARFRPGLYEGIEAFIRDGQFVLVWCGNEFWMSREGEITDT
jgi:hypothetical protein